MHDIYASGDFTRIEFVYQMICGRIRLRVGWSKFAGRKGDLIATLHTPSYGYTYTD